MNLRRTIAAVMVLGTVVVGCEKNKLDENPTESRYEVSLRDSQNEVTIILKEVTPEVDIVSVDNPLSWIETSHSREQGTCLFTMKRLSETPGKFEKESIKIKLSNSNTVTVVVVREELLRPSGENSADYEKFNKAWWEQDKILYATTVYTNDVPTEQSVPISLPWSSATVSNIPSGLIFATDTGENMLQAKYGWEMAFNLFDSRDSEGKLSSKPYFALYNKYTGILRVFYYQQKDPGTGGEFSFFVTPDSESSQKYPLYNSLQYGIPMSAGEVQNKGNVLGVTKSSNLFAQYVTPYFKNPEKIALSIGWYCFDLDYSAYNPDVDTSFKPNVDRLSIDCMTASVENITLRGALTGRADGTFDAKTSYSTTTSNGLNYLDQFNSGVSGFFDCVANFTSKEYLKGIANGGMTIYHMAKALFGYATDDYTTTGTTTGNINMSLGADMTMAGYSVAQTSNSGVSVEFDCSAYNQSEHWGQGVWSLEGNPVVYVVYDDLLYDENYGDVTFTVKKDGLFTGTLNPQDADFRLFTFFDPSSIKININEKAIGGDDNLKNNYYTVHFAYGVYPNRPLGYYDKYKNGILEFDKNGCIAKLSSLVDRSKVHEEQGLTLKTMEDYGTYTTSGRLDKENRFGKASNYFDQIGEKFRYCGSASNGRSADDEDMFICDPIVLLPTSYETGNDGMLLDFVTPDYVVGIMLEILCHLEDDKPAKILLSKEFIPEIRAISSREFEKKYYDQVQNSIKDSVPYNYGFLYIEDLNQTGATKWYDLVTSARFLLDF